MLKRLNALLATLGLLVTLTVAPSFAQDKKDDKMKDDKMAEKDKRPERLIQAKRARHRARRSFFNWCI